MCAVYNWSKLTELSFLIASVNNHNFVYQPRQFSNNTYHVEKDSVLYAVDHHRGSEEHQLGEEYHDADLYDASINKMDTFKVFRDTLQRFQREDAVVPLVSTSATASKCWATPLSLVFIDGGHSEQAAQTDYESWAGHVREGGILCIHDLFPDPADGGQAPYNIWKRALASGCFEEIEVVETLGFLRRRG